MHHPTTDIQVVADINTIVVGMAPAMALASRLLNLAFAESLAALNAVHAQQEQWISAQTAGTVEVIALLSSK